MKIHVTIVISICYGCGYESTSFCGRMCSTQKKRCRSQRLRLMGVVICTFWKRLSTYDLDWNLRSGCRKLASVPIEIPIRKFFTLLLTQYLCGWRLIGYRFGVVLRGGMKCIFDEMPFGGRERRGRFYRVEYFVQSRITEFGLKLPTLFGVSRFKQFFSGEVTEVVENWK